MGRWLCRAALASGWQVIAAVTAAESLTPAERTTIVSGDLRDPATGPRLAATAPDAVVHLAAIASGAAARRDPATAWTVNAGGTAALAEALAARGPRFLLVSTGEVYGRGHHGPIPETAPVAPVSPYAASKAGAEIAAQEVARRTGLPVVIARPFPHTGPGQSTTYVYPALAAKLRQAAREGRQTVTAGDLTPVRDLLDVRDVVTAYLGILEHGAPGGIYNVASGTGESLAASYARLAALTGSHATAEIDPALLRTADLPVLIGDATTLRTTTGWAPVYTREQTFRDLVDAQAD